MLISSSSSSNSASSISTGSTGGPSGPPGRLAVIGGGVSGLAAAHRWVERGGGSSAALFEAGPRVGGVLETVVDDGFQIELGSDSFVTNRPWAVDLCRRLDFEPELIGVSEKNRRAFVVRKGKLLPVPEGFVMLRPTKLRAVMTSPILSLWGKLRLAAEWFIPPRPEAVGDESLASFARRRFGDEVFERLVQPLVGGIYTADAEQLSLAATLPQFLEMERKYGGLLKSVVRGPVVDEKNTSGARYGLFVTPRRGMGSLVEAIQARIPASVIRLRSRVEKLSPKPEGGWILEGEGIAGPFREEFDAVVVAAPGPAAARLCGGFDAELASDLAAIPYAGAAVVSLGYRREDIAHPLDGFGFVVPDAEKRRILACSFSSVKFPGRAPDGEVLMRVFVGGAKRPDLVSLDDDDLQWIVHRELEQLLGVRGRPRVVRIARYADRMPQYHVGHLDRVARIEARAEALPGFALAGNAYRGVGIPDCIRSGEQAADVLFSHLEERNAASRG